jgi:5'-methylthioadenosine phosphorylase
MANELVGVIGGSGLGDALAQQLTDVQKHEIQTPFGKTSGPIMAGRLGERQIVFVNRHGPGHTLSPSEVPYAANLFALKQLGVHSVIASGAVGSLRSEIAPGDLVIVDQFIDKTFRRLGTFFTGYGAVHCEMAEPACGRLRGALLHAAEPAGIRIHAKGTYICMEGPQFSTRAESLMHRALGGDLIGMTALPEAKLAREAQMCYALIALASDYDCWRPHGAHSAGEGEKASPAYESKQMLIHEIMANMKTATDNCLKLLRAALAGGENLVCEDCACRKSLELAVWTDPKAIVPARKERLAVLFE